MRYYFLTRRRGVRAVAYCLAVLTTCVTCMAVGPASAWAQRTDQVKAQSSEPDAPWLLEGPKPASVPTPAPADLQQAIDRGIAFLLDDQNKDGSWGTPEKTKGLNIFAPVPGAHHAFRTAVTSLCLCALTEMGSQRPEVAQSIDRGEAWLMENLPKLRRADPVAIYNVWGHGYAVLALVRMHQRHADDPARQKEIIDLLETQYDYLDRYESVDGGWGYYDFRVRIQETCHGFDQLSVRGRPDCLPRGAWDRCSSARKARPNAPQVRSVDSRSRTSATSMVSI